jgi:hypothetical protein
MDPENREVDDNTPTSMYFDKVDGGCDCSGGGVSDRVMGGGYVVGLWQDLQDRDASKLHMLGALSAGLILVCVCLLIVSVFIKSDLMFTIVGWTLVGSAIVNFACDSAKKVSN